MKTKIRKYEGIWYMETHAPNKISIRLWRYTEGWSIFIRQFLYPVFPIIQLQYSHLTAKEVKRELPEIINKMNRIREIVDNGTKADLRGVDPQRPEKGQDHSMDAFRYDLPGGN